MFRIKSQLVMIILIEKYITYSFLFFLNYRKYVIFIIFSEKKNNQQIGAFREFSQAIKAIII